MNNYITVKEAARLLKVSANTVYNRLIYTGIIPAFQPGGPKSRILVKEEDVRRYIEGRRVS